MKRGEEEIFPDPLSAPLATDREHGLVKTLKRANAELLPPPDSSTTFVVAKSREEVFAAINAPGGWWDGEVTGTTDELDAEFTYRHGQDHLSVQRVAELVAAQRVVWEVVSSELGFVDETEPWTSTHIVFDIEPVDDGTRVSLVHRGLVPALECYDACSATWQHVAGHGLRHYIETGIGIRL